jgi:hypothetical protein
VNLSKNKIISVKEVSGLESWYTAAQASSLVDRSILNLSRNLISSLDVNDFASYGFLKVLDLSWNNISFIDPRVFSSNNKALNTFDLTGNPILFQGCPDGYRKILTEFSSLIRYPSCVKVRITKISPPSSTYSSLPEDFQLQIECEGLDIDLNKNIVTLNGIPCAAVGFLIPPTFYRTGTLFCIPPKQLSTGSNVKLDVNLAISIENDTVLFSKVYSLSLANTTVILNEIPENIHAYLFPSQLSLSLAWSFRFKSSKEKPIAFRIYRRAAGSLNVTITTSTDSARICNGEVYLECAFSFEIQSFLPQYFRIAAISSSFNEGPISGEFGPFYPICTKGEYLSTQHDDIEKRICKSCPEGSFCNGGNFSNIVSLPGYWRVFWEKSEPIFIKCLSNLACPNEFNDGNACSEGSNGVLCANCIDGYASTIGIQGFCSKCASRSSNFFLILTIFIATIVLILGLTLLTLKDESKKNEFSSISEYSMGMIVKVVLSHMQQVSLMKNFGFAWPSEVLSLMDVFNFAGSFSDYAFSFKCISSGISFFGGDFLYSFIVLVLFSPLLVLFGVFVISYISYAKFKSHPSSSLNSIFAAGSSWIRSLFKFCLITTLVVMHPKLTEQVMKLFACVKVYDRTYLLSSMSIDCDSDQHKLFSRLVGVPFILLICIGIPLVLFYKVFSVKKKHANDLNHILWSEYAFITRSYRTEVAMWECIIMIRKMGIAFLSVILSSRSFEIQILWGTLLLLFFLTVHAIWSPYKFPFINTLESISLAIAIATFVLGGYLGSSSSIKSVSSTTNQWISVATIGINAFFIGFVVLIVLKRACKTARRKFKGTALQESTRPERQIEIPKKLLNT